MTIILIFTSSYKHYKLFRHHRTQYITGSVLQACINTLHAQKYVHPYMCFWNIVFQVHFPFLIK